jgi:ribosomal protein S2
VGYQKGAVSEANKLGIPVIGVVDTTLRKASIT